jgi:hypothetical protein
VPDLDFLEGDLAAQLLVVRDEDDAQTALGVRPQDAEAQPRGGQRADRVRPRGVRVGFFGVVSGGRCLLGRRAGDGDVGQAGLQVGVGDLLEVLAYRPDGADGRQAARGVVAVLVEVLADEGLQQGVFVLVQGALVPEDVAEGPGLVQHPGAHGGDELVARDEVHLHGQDAEQEIEVGRWTGRRRGRHGARPRR